MQLFATVVGLVRLPTTCLILRITVAKKSLPHCTDFQRRDGRRLLISSVYRGSTRSREWLARTLSFLRLLLPIPSRWLPSRLPRARLSLRPNARHARNPD